MRRTGGNAEKTEQTSEIHEETTAPSIPAHRDGSDRNNSAVESQATVGMGDIDLAKLQVNAGLADDISRQIDTLGIEQYDGRLRRLELGMLRLERINLEILAMVQKLVSAVKRNDQEGSV